MSQTNKILMMLLDRKAHSNFEIHEKTGILRYSARLHDLRQKGYEIKTYQDLNDPQKWWFKLVRTPLEVEENELMIKEGLTLAS